MIDHLDDHYWEERKRLEKLIEEGRRAEAKLVRLNYDYAPKAYSWAEQEPKGADYAGD